MKYSKVGFVSSQQSVMFPSMWLQEVAEPLQDLKEGMDQLEKNKTLRYILTTLLAIGNFLNSTDVSGSEHMNDSAPTTPPLGVFYSLHFLPRSFSRSPANIFIWRG